VFFASFATDLRNSDKGHKKHEGNAKATKDSELNAVIPDKFEPMHYSNKMPITTPWSIA
jgi:hypothetical protein